jgi:broad specificity phosphatase PhoE
MTRILLVRHGESEYNSSRRFAGHVDIDLTEMGCRQVERLHERLAEEKIDVIYCSDLLRARRTAEIATRGRDIPMTICPELREISYGEVEGLAFTEIKSRFPDLAKQLSTSELELAFPGGETFTQLVDRVVTFKERLAGHGQSETVLVVAHGGPLRALLCSMLSLSQSCWWQLSVDNASLSIIQTYTRGAVLTLLNETCHLRDLNMGSGQKKDGD